MNQSEYNLKKFCSIKGIIIAREREVQYGKQYSLLKNGETVHLIIFPENSLVQGKKSQLKEVMSIWAHKTIEYNGGFQVDLPSGWREWNENANWIESFHKNHGVPKESELNHRYIINREIMFHDYMFRNSSYKEITFEKFENLVRAWFKRNCFMNLDVDLLISKMKQKVEKGIYLNLTLENISLSIAADFLAEQFSSACQAKYICLNGNCYCPQTEADHIDCVLDIVDALYPYFSNYVLSYTKGNLNKLLKRDNDLSWKDVTPSTPIEEIMSKNLENAGILALPQFQAWDENHRYSIDFAIKTPQGLNIAIECDGLEYHAKPSAYIHDRKRDRYLQNKGFYVMRFSSVEIYNEIEKVIEEIDESYWKIQKQRIDIRTPYRLNYFGYGNEE